VIGLFKPEWEDVRHIAEHMRPCDREEIFATQWDDDPAAFTERFCAVAMNFCWVARVDDEPVALIGAVPQHPGVWSVFMFATDRFPEVKILLTRHVKRIIIPTLREDSKAHLAFCYSLDRHTAAHKWLECLGAKRELVIPEFGKNRETFYMFTWRN